MVSQDKIEELYETTDRLLHSDSREEVSEIPAHLLRDTLDYPAASVLSTGGKPSP